MAESESNSQETDNLTKDSNSNITKQRDETNQQNHSNTYLFFTLGVLGVVILGIVLENLEVLKVPDRNTAVDKKLKYWVYSDSHKVEDENGLLKHLHLVLKRIGYEKSKNDTSWKLLWSHDYPFRVLYPHLHRLKPDQRVNHFPGTGFITNKVDLATTQSKYIPRAFKLPKNKEEFLKYAEKNKNAWFLEKDNQHRGIHLKNISEIDLTSGTKFVQEYMQNPFLVDGYKFDIGVYVVLTSVNPLRAYWYKGDVLFRYCPTKYYPFDPKDLDKYVVADKYLPAWHIPALARTFSALGLGMKDSFDVYARSKGKDPDKMWEEVQEAIAEVLLIKEKHIIHALKDYPSQNNFFELMRFDLVLDEDLKVYLLEANMSPNLSAPTKLPNQLLYEQMLYNLFPLVDISRPLTRYSSEDDIESSAATRMVSTDKNIAVWGEACDETCVETCDGVCGLCRHCLKAPFRETLLRAHGEHLHRADFRRIFPPAMVPSTAPKEHEDMSNWTPNNKLQYLWYQGKCNMDVTWCS